MKILITGGNGFLAKNIKKHLTKYDITSISRNDFDLRDSSAVNKFFENKYFDIVIHCAVLGGNRLKEESKDIVCDNIKLAMNLMMNQKSFGKLIHFGSGAELDRNKDITQDHDNYINLLPEDYYGLSKNIIARLLENYKNTYNLRIFTIIAEDEADRRMIKGNILNYIKKLPIVIHQDRFMDFMYVNDFIQILDKYINDNSLPKEIDCVYDKKYKLSDIANMINNLTNHKVEILVNDKNNGLSYCGKFYDLGIEYLGIETAIHNVYRATINNTHDYL